MRDYTTALKHLEQAVGMPDSATAIPYHYFHNMITTCARMGNPAQALHALHLLRRSGRHPAQKTSGVLIHTLCKAGHFREAYNTVQAMWRKTEMRADGRDHTLNESELQYRRPSEKTVSRVASTAISSGRPDLAVSLLQMMQQSGVRLTLFSYSIMFKALARICDGKAVLQLLSTLEQDDDDVVDVTVVNSAIDALVCCGLLAKAELLLNDMERFHLRADVRSYNPLLRELARRGDTTHVLSLRDAMRAQGLDETAYTVNCVIMAHVTASEFDKAHAELQRGLQASLQGHVAANGSGVKMLGRDACVAYSAIIGGLARDGRLGAADDVLLDLVRRATLGGQHRSLHKELGVAFSAVIVAELRAGDLIGGVQRLRDMHEKYGLRRSSDAYCATISGLARHGGDDALQAACVLLHEMETLQTGGWAQGRGESRVFNSTDMTMAYNTVMGAYARVGNMDEAEAVLRTMQYKGVWVTVVTFTILVDGYGRCGDLAGAQNAWRRMEESEIHLDVTLMNAMIGACVRCGSMDVAQDVFTNVQRGGVVVADVVTFSAMISGHVRDDRVDLAWRFYAAMKANGIRPNERLVDRMLAALVDPRLLPSRDAVWGIDDEEGKDEEDDDADASYGDVYVTEVDLNGGTVDEDTQVEMINGVVTEADVTEEGGVTEGGVTKVRHVMDGDVTDTGVTDTGVTAGGKDGRNGGWLSLHVQELLEDMEKSKCSETTKRRWRAAVASI